jgi:glycine hydroxymethyltransferase
MNEEAMKTIAKVIGLTLKNPKDEAVLEKARGLVKDLTAQYPLYPGLTY